MVCITSPPEKADRSPECDAIERGAGFSGMGGERLIGTGVVHRAEYDLGIVASMTDRKGIGEVSEESIKLIRNDLAKSFQRHGLGLVSPPGVDPIFVEPVEVRGARGLHFTFTVTGTAVPMRIIAYFLYQRDRAHTVLFVAPATNARELRDYADRVLATLQVPPGDLRMFGKPRWQRNAQWMAVRLAPFFVGALIVIPGLYLWDRRRRAAKPARLP